MASLRDINEDENYLAYKAVLNVASKKINLDTILDEAKVMHASRPARDLYKVKLEPTAVYQAASKDINVRSRLVEIRAQVFRQRSVIHQATKKLRTYLGTTYQEAIRQKGSTQQDRNLYMDRILTKGLTMIDSFDSALELIDTYIKDLDQTGFAVRNITDVLKLLMNPNKSGVNEV